jgi:molybdate transport repressor ModE-like protein
MIEIRHMRLLEAIREAGSMSGAARLLGLSQPAVSQQVQALERTLGMPVIVRGSGPARLTEAALVLLRHAETVLPEIEKAEAELDALAGLQAGRVRIACFPSAASTILPRALGRMRRDYPGVSFTMTEAEPLSALKMLRENRVEIAIVNAYSDEYDGADAHAAMSEDTPEGLSAADIAVHGDLSGIPLRESEVAHVLLTEKMWVALPSTHEQAHTPVVDLADLAGESWIAGCPQCRAHLMRASDDAGFRPDIVFETDDHNALQELAAAGLGVALVTDLMVSSRNQRSGYALRPTTEQRTRVVSAISTESLLAVPGVAQTIAALELAARDFEVPHPVDVA